LNSLHLIRKIAIIMLISLASFVILVGGLTYFFRDRIMTSIISELNHHLEADIQVSKASLTFLQNFPYISLSFSDVRIAEPKDFGNGNLAVAKNVYFAFNPVNLLLKNYEVEKIVLEHAVVNVTINKEGKGNFHLLKTDSTVSADSELNFSLSQISMEDVLVNFSYEPSAQFYSVLHKSANANLSQEKDILKIGMDGDLFVYELKISGQTYFKNKALKIASKQTYSLEKENLEILPSTIMVEQSKFHIGGNLNFKEKNTIDLSIEGEKGRVQTLISLLPTAISNHLNNYKSEGNVYFNGIIKGEVSAQENPLIKVDFGFEDASIRNTEMKGEVRHANLNGTFTNGEERRAHTSELRISKFNGRFQDMPVKGYFIMTNFENPSYEVSCSGEIDLATFLKFYPVANLETAGGTIQTDFYLRGKPDDLQHHPERIAASGELKLKNTSFVIKDVSYKFNNLNGNFLFNKNDVAINDFKGFVNENDFLLNGYFRNLIPNLLFADEKLEVDARLVANKLNLNDFLIPEKSTKNNKTSRSSKNQYDFKKQLALTISCQVENLTYKRLEINRFSGELNYSFPVCHIRNMKGEMCGGSFNSNTSLEWVSENTRISTTLEASGIEIEQLFDAFENFDQDFVTDQNLKGTLDTETELIILLDQNMGVIYPQLLGKIQMRIKAGELNNFSPMHKMSNFLKEKDLYNVRFSELTNDFIIKNNSIIIPEMKINSSVSNISISGTHTFDDQLDYKLAVPLKNFAKKDSDEAFGAVEQNISGQSTVFLTIKGSSDNLKVGYDTQRTRKKITSDLKKEKEDIVDILKGRKPSDEKQKDASLSDEEYFDF
jgi:hypothetical protein